jgi:hypothetical protein
MGLFDYIKCEMPLPETPLPPYPDENGDKFQTKDTPYQYMTTYTITADGRLTWRPYDMQTVPVEERPYPDMPIIGSQRRVEQEPEAIPFHGDVDFYHYASGGWWEYRARFTEGICKAITLLEYRPPDEPA